MKHDRDRHRSILDMLMRRYDRQIIMNANRADYVECMVALALGKDWWLPWTRGWDWSPWDCEHSSGARVEIKQAAARQSWDRDALAPTRTPRFDIAPRTGYWLADGNQWVDRPGRPADVYVFAWHGEREREHTDHRDADQWRFLVVAEKDLPADRKTITSKKLETLVAPCSIDVLREAVESALPERKKADRGE